MYRSLLILVFLISLPIFAQDRAGHEVGNGADILPAPEVWFKGEDTIYYCVKQPAVFWGSLEDQDLILAMDEAFKFWMDYIERNQINKRLRAEYIKNYEHEWAFEPIPTKSKYLTKCDSSLRNLVSFYYSSWDDAVDKRLPHFRRPWGISFVEDEKLGHVGIWINPEARRTTPIRRNVIQELMIHELGHALGIGHIKGTVMDEDIASFLAGTRVSWWGYQFSYPNSLDFATPRNLSREFLKLEGVSYRVSVNREIVFQTEPLFRRVYKKNNDPVSVYLKFKRSWLDLTLNNIQTYEEKRVNAFWNSESFSTPLGILERAE